MGKIIEIRNLYKATINDVASNVDNWITFLKSASWNFKYDFDDQILIYAQRPDAKACAEMEVWNKKLKRWVNKNAKVIFVTAKEDGLYPYRMIFDVSDTHNYKNTSYKLWEVKKEYENEIIDTLKESFGNIEENNDLAKSIYLSAYNMIIDNMQDYLLSIQNNKLGTELEDMTNDEIQAIFIPTLWASVSYIMMIRCGINPENYINISEFSYISKFKNENLITIFGTATSDIAEMGLREIARTVIDLQNEEKRKNRTFVKNQKIDYFKNKDIEKGGDNDDRYRIQTTRQLYDTKFSNGGGETSRWKIRKNEITLPKDTKESRIYNFMDEQEFIQALESDTGDSDKKNEFIDRTNDTETGNNREFERNKSDGVDRNYEQYSSNSRADSNKRNNLQLNKDNLKEAENASFFNEETIKNIIENSPNVLKNKVEFRDYIFDNYEDVDKCKAYIKEILGNAYTEFDVESERVGYKVNEDNLNIWRGNYLTRTEECFKDWDTIANYCISNNVHFITPEFNKDKYTFLVGDTIYIGQEEFIISELNNGIMTIYDSSFPLDRKEFVIDDIILKIAENSLNDYLKEDRGIEEKQENSFGKWLDTFIKEKGINLEDTFSLDGDNNFHIFEVGNVIENIKIAPPEEQAQIKDMLVKIDFNNGSVLDFIRHLAQALVKDYEKEQKQEIEDKTLDNKIKQNDIAEKIIKKNRNIEYFNLHPEVPIEERNNFKISDDNLGIGTDREKYKNNIEAIKVLKLCEKENRYATKEEQEILSKYIGWGGLKAVFEKDNSSFANEYLELKNILTEEEYDNAKASSVTAYYTPPIVIKNIYKALQNMGLKQANILEPSCRSR